MSRSSNYRSLLFIPGNQPKMLDKALGFKPDAYIPDMEDSVPEGEKQNARAVIQTHLQTLSSAGIPVIPRVNARDTDLTADDLRSVVCADIHGISVGKINHAEDVAWLDALITDLERAQGMTAGGLTLVLWIETARGVMNCFDICQSNPRIQAVAFGAEDFSHDMAIERLDDESNVWFARQSLCVAARAAGVQALDTPYFKFKDDAGLQANAETGKKIGFTGKFAIHPGQIETINRVFSPSAEEIAHAQRVLAAFAEAERQGRGSTSLDGMVIDVPVVKRARALLARAQGVNDIRENNFPPHA